MGVTKPCQFIWFRDTHATGGNTIENVAFRAGAYGARIQNLRAESCRNQVSLLILLHNNTVPWHGCHETIYIYIFRDTHAMRGKNSKISGSARERTEPGFGICAPRTLEIRSRF
jgi:hypothetical protein